MSKIFQSSAELNVFSVNDVAFLLGMRRERLVNWTRNEFAPIFEKKEKSVFSFSELLELRLIKLAVDGIGLPIRDVRAAHCKLREQLQTKTPISGGQVRFTSKEVLLMLKNGSYVNINSGQYESALIEDYLVDLRRDKEGNVFAWEVWSQNNEIIIVNPNIMGGLPVFEDSRIDTHFIVSQLEANDYNVETVAVAYNLRESQVIEAVKYELKQAA